MPGHDSARLLVTLRALPPPSPPRPMLLARSPAQFRVDVNPCSSICNIATPSVRAHLQAKECHHAPLAHARPLISSL